MLLSSGGFAVYRSESNAINLLEPRFGDLSVRRNRERLVEAWLSSKLFRRSGLDAEAIKAKILSECRNGGDFLCIVMAEIARSQGVERWADCTPEHLLHLARIKETIPDALIVHIIRDGRDVALSLEKQNWIRPFPWDRQHPLLASGLYWEWMVRKGRDGGRRLGDDYCEVRFEELIQSPRSVLSRLGQFIAHDLDYNRIRETGIGSVSEPNTSFKSENVRGEFNPVGRWRNGIPTEELKLLEALTGGTLRELGYPLAFGDESTPNRPDFRRMRSLYLHYFDLKLWLKAKTPLGRFFVTRSLSWL
jgi:hypothetical protein